MSSTTGFASICAHDPVLPGAQRAHVLPLFSTSTFVYESPDSIQKVISGESDAYIYSRWKNPTTEIVEQKIAALECFRLQGADGAPLVADALLFSSGMAAISALFLACLKQGDKILTHKNIYGTSTELIQNVLSGLGIEAVYADFRNPDEVRQALAAHPEIRLVYIETPNNPTLSCYNLEQLSRLAHQAEALCAVDNTFASPYFQKPFAFGVDLVVHSTTKYLNGHGTALGGIVVGTDRDFMRKKVWKIRKTVGGNSNAWDSWLLNNGLKTLPLRMEKHQQNALALAKYLASHPAVSKVNYPGLPSHPDHELAKRQMTGFGGVLSFELKDGLEAGKALMRNIRFCTLTSTLGTPDTLIAHPASMTHVQVPREQRLAGGITDGLIRVSVGIEDVQDILNDLEQAMKGL